MKIFKEEESSSFFLSVRTHPWLAWKWLATVIMHGLHTKAWRRFDRSFPIYHKDRLFRIEIARRSVNVSLRSCNGHFQCLFRVSLSLSLLFPSCFERGLNDGVGARMKDLDEKALGNWSFFHLFDLSPSLLLLLRIWAHVQFSRIDPSVRIDWEDSNLRLEGNYNIEFLAWRRVSNADPFRYFFVEHGRERFIFR